MKKLLLTLLPLFFATSVFAETLVSGAVSGIWTLAGSPYLVIGNIFVPANQELSIQAGVRVEFQGTFRFTVQGELFCSPEPGETVFTQDTIAYPQRWLGIQFVTVNTHSMLNHVTIEFAAGRENGIVVSNGAGVTFNECIFNDFVTTALTVDDTEIDVNNCIFNRCGATGGCGGAIRAHNITGTIAGQFKECGSLDGGAVCLYNSLVQLTACVFERNRATLWGGALYADNCELEFTNCYFFENAGLTGGVFSIHHSPSTVFSHCVFSGNTGNRDGISGSYGVGYFLTGTNYYFENCIFENNTANNISVIYSLSPCQFKECVFTENPGSVLLNGSQIEVTYSDFWPQPVLGGGAHDDIGELMTLNLNGDSVDIYSNLVAPPDFLDPGEAPSPYYPNFLSPLIDAGDTNIVEWDGTHPEIGYQEYFHLPKVEDLTIQRIGESNDILFQWTPVGQGCTYRILRSLESEWNWNAIEIVAETQDTFWVQQNAVNQPFSKANYLIRTHNCQFGR